MKIKKLSKILMLPIISTMIIGVNSIKVDAQEKNYQIIMEKYLNALVSQDIDDIVDNSIDSRFESKEEYKNMMKDLFDEGEDDVIITKYKVLEDENPNDENFIIRTHYLNGEITDINLKVDTLHNKVLTGMDLEDVSNTVKKGTDKYQIIISETPLDNIKESFSDTRAMAGSWNKSLNQNGTTSTSIFSSGGSSVAINYRQEYVSGNTQSVTILYELRKQKSIGSDILGSKSINKNTVGNSNASQFYFNTGTGIQMKNCFVKLTNGFNNTIKVLGEAYI